jgi:hypothetical protein
MKSWRALKEQMDARRRAEGKTVTLYLDLPYRMKKGEEQAFLEPFEVEEINERIKSMVSLMTPEQMNDAKDRAREIKNEYIKSIGSFAPRITAYLLRSAVALRYRKGDRVEIPRKGPEGTKPGVWWGELQVKLEDYPAQIDMPVGVAQWLVATWQDDKVQNGLDDKVQAWANVLDEEITRLSAALNAPAKIDQPV